MAGTREGGRLAAKANKENHGEDFYKKIGAKGGSVKGKLSGFASEKTDKNGLTGRDRASKFGSIGGYISRRGKDSFKAMGVVNTKLSNDALIRKHSN